MSGGSLNAHPGLAIKPDEPRFLADPLLSFHLIDEQINSLTDLFLWH